MKTPSIFGKYLLLERLNVGGMAEILVAKAFGVEGFERILAIKKILPTLAEDEEFITMFIDEARISVQLNHANIVHIHELGKYQDTYFIAMEYVAGRDLRAILEHFRRRKEQMPISQAVLIASKMCEGLDYAHRKKDARGIDLGIIHRDISPQNILVSFEGEVKLIDFGIAKAAIRSQKTQAGILKGKFGYMSPEQVRGLPMDRRSDLFAVGAILYEMLTGGKLFLGESDYSTLEKVRNAVVPLPSNLNPRVPKELEQIVLRALAREPDDRYQWASDLNEDLVRFLVSSDPLYTAKSLSSFMKEAFAEDMLREEEKMQRFAAVQRPDELEVSTAGSLPRIPRRNSPRPIPVIRPPGQAEDSGVQESPSSENTQLSMMARVDSENEPATDGVGVDGRILMSPVPKVSKEDTAVDPADSRRSVLEKTANAEPTHPELSAGSLRSSAPNRQIVVGPENGYGGETVVGAPAPVSEAGPFPSKEEPQKSVPNGSLGRRVLFLIVGILAVAAGAYFARSTPKSAAVLISASPQEGVVITLDGAEVKNRAVTTLQPGEHDLSVAAEGYKPYRKRLLIEAGSRPLAIPVTLEMEANLSSSSAVPPVQEGVPAKGSEPVRERPAITPKPENSRPATAPTVAVPRTFGAKFISPEEGIAIWVEGKLIGRTPMVTLSKLSVERAYRYEARLPGFRTVMGELRYGGRPEQEVPIRLQRLAVREEKAPPRPSARSRPAQPATVPKGRLACSSNPASADVYVDGKFTGQKTPVPFKRAIELPVGVHQVVFRLGDKSSAPQLIEIRENQLKALTNVQLE